MMTHKISLSGAISESKLLFDVGSFSLQCFLTSNTGVEEKGILTLFLRRDPGALCDELFNQSFWKHVSLLFSLLVSAVEILADSVWLFLAIDWLWWKLDSANLMLFSPWSYKMPQFMFDKERMNKPTAGYGTLPEVC